MFVDFNGISWCAVDQSWAFRLAWTRMMRLRLPVLGVAMLCRRSEALVSWAFSRTVKGLRLGAAIRLLVVI